MSANRRLAAFGSHLAGAPAGRSLEPAFPSPWGTRNSPGAFTTMTPKERYSFDLNGYIVLENFLSPSLVDGLNASIDRFAKDETKVRWQSSPGSTNGGEKRPWVVSPIEGDTRLAGDHDRGGISAPCGWPEPWCNPFRALTSHTLMLRYVLELMGNGFRYTGLGAFFANKGTEGHVLHSGGTGTFGDEGGTTLNMGGHMYLCQNGQMWTNFIGVAYQLRDVTAEDGGFICIPGSHKANFDCPMDVRALVDDLGGSVRHLEMKKGSALIWTEALAHGTLPWTSDEHRRAIVLRYSAANLANGTPPLWDGMSPLQEGLAERPYDNHDGNPRPDIAALITEEEALLAATPSAADPQKHWQWYE